MLCTLLLPTALALRGFTAIGAPQLDWVASEDIAQQSDGGLIVTSDGDGNVFVIGATPLFAGGEDMIIIKYDAAGVKQWSTFYAGYVRDGYEVPVDAAVDADGNLYVTGPSGIDDVALIYEWVTFKLAPDKALLWERRYHGAGTYGGPLPRDMAMGPNGEIVVAGWARDDAGFVDFGTVKYAQDGTVLWERQFSSPGFEPDGGEAVAVGDDGSVVVVGQYVQGDDYVIGTVRYDADGTLQWSATFDASALAGLEDWVRSVAVDPAGNIYVGASGIDNFTDGRDFVLLKYDTAGNLLWDRRVIEPTTDGTPTVLLGPEGNVYLSGPSSSGHRLVAFDADGNQLWTERHTGSVTDDSLRDHVAIDAEGHVVVLLRTVFEPDISAFTIVRYAPDGVVVDETTIDPEGVTRWPTGLSCDNQGHLCATGWWSPAGSRDVLTYRRSLSAPGLPGDLDGNGSVNLVDFATFATCFGLGAPDITCDAAEFEGSDLDENGVVNLSDFATFALSFTG